MSRSIVSRARNEERGFTLIEVLTTIVIMGIIFAIATTSWRGVIERRAVDAASNQLAADLRLAHSSATNQLADYAVVKELASAPLLGSLTGCGAGDYYLVKIPNTGVPTCADVTVRDLSEDDRAQMSTTTPLRFKPNGSVRNIDDTEIGGEVGIAVYRAGDPDSSNQHAVEVVPTTSRIQIDPS